MPDNNTTQALRKFRLAFEYQTAKPADQIEATLAYVLADICKALQMTPAQTRTVLGTRGNGAVKRYSQSRITASKRAVRHNRSR